MIRIFNATRPSIKRRTCCEPAVVTRCLPPKPAPASICAPSRYLLRHYDGFCHCAISLGSDTKYRSGSGPGVSPSSSDSPSPSASSAAPVPGLPALPVPPCGHCVPRSPSSSSTKASPRAIPSKSPESFSLFRCFSRHTATTRCTRPELAVPIHIRARRGARAGLDGDQADSRSAGKGRGLPRVAASLRR